MVQVHPITSLKEGSDDIFTPSLPFMPTDILSNSTEKSFVVWGERGILVGHFPSMLQNIRQKRMDAQNLDQAPTDAEIECEIVADLELERSQSLTVVQAEYSAQYTNYLSVLFQEQNQDSSVTNTFKLFSLLLPNMPCELSFDLHDLIPNAHRYSSFNKDLKFVAFAQAAAESETLGTLDFFNVSFLTKCGDVYTLGPLLL
mmetsp:Transcript_20099/g.27159  ORF Transcript_20099/g.27159 Transcript_20099/m.27159 type:complete len:201 (+) Transcript_20099:369-971(+)|eukprot:CAMPEP_0185583790 /NCGR_PEP_ID=MMETSP0434-20130131/27747_1 /TAXON_ID=626734 ORGANISM="Favella taraikaensis, Strain Fe Narragansett Bay" /NCGR_SAMPLE_ID=MMETSP0434 /ASSEMBLY_ACC=CAM_ASM_000379 /LENGTH=200 /DNA_ID=CAMNT_0028203125 /DNA_START=358 /DNA_END=963 /DNA_ORIENTATION=-